MRPIKEWKNKLAITLIYLAVVAVLLAIGGRCVFRTYLGFPCPGCGMSRAMLSALRLDFAAAFSYHPMFWAMPILYLYFLYDGALFRKKWLDRALLILFAAGFVIHWVFSLVSMSNL